MKTIDNIKYQRHCNDDNEHGHKINLIKCQVPKHKRVIPATIYFIFSHMMLCKHYVTGIINAS